MKYENQTLKEKFETVRSFCNVGKTSATPASVPKQNKEVQRVQISHSNDLIPDQQAIQRSDGQVQIFPQSEGQQHQSILATQLESTIASPAQVSSQLVLQSTPQNNSDANKSPMLVIQAIPGTSGTSGLQSSLAKNDSQKLAQMVQILPSKPLVQRPDVLVSIGCVQGPKGKNLGRVYVDGQAKATRDDPEEETIKTEIEAEGQQQQPMGLAQHESIIAPPMAKKPKS